MRVSGYLYGLKIVSIWVLIVVLIWCALLVLCWWVFCFFCCAIVFIGGACGFLFAVGGKLLFMFETCLLPLDFGFVCGVVLIYLLLV